MEVPQDCTDVPAGTRPAPEPRSGHLDIDLPRAVDPAVLDQVLRLHVESALRASGEWPTSIIPGVGVERAPGVTRWPVTYVTGPAPRTGQGSCGTGQGR